MADVKWIKFYISILTDPKIKRIRRLPDGNTIALIWAYLLAQAGKSNKDGALYFTDEITYSEEDFAEDYSFGLDTVRLAVRTFEMFGMIEIYDGIIYVKNWEKYQNTDGLEKMKEQNRLRQARHKEKQKLLQGNVIGNVTDNVEVTQDNALDIDKEIEIDKDIKKNNSSRFTPPTLNEVHEYCTERKNNVDASKFIDFYSSKGWMVGKNKMKDWKASVRTWEKDNKPNTQQRPSNAAQASPNNRFNQFPQRDYTQQNYDDVEQRMMEKAKRYANGE